MLKLWLFTWRYFGVYGAAPNVIFDVCGEGVAKLFGATPPLFFAPTDCKSAVYTLPHLS